MVAHWIRKHQSISSWLSFIVVLFFVTVILWQPLLATSQPLRSYDGVYHAALVKKMISEHSQARQENLFWGKINTNYPPVFHDFTYWLSRVTGVTSINALVKIVTGLNIFSCFLLFFFIARKIFRRSIFPTSLALIFLAIAVYPMRRLSFFLPENMAFVFLLAFIFLLIQRGMNRILQISGGILLLTLIVFTNVLTATIAFSALAVWIPILIWKKQWSTAGNLGLLGVVVLLGTLPFLKFDTFWVNYLKKIIPLIVTLLVLAFGFRLLEKKRTFLFARTTYLVGAGILGVAYLVNNQLAEAPLWQHFLTEQYWSFGDLPIKMSQLISKNFFSNGVSQLSINPVVSWIGLLGVGWLVAKRKIFSEEYGYVTIIFSISLLSFIFGAYIGINPSINAPRAMLYIAFILPLFAAAGLNAFLAKQKAGLGIAVIAVVLITSIGNVYRHVSHVDATPLPKAIVQTASNLHQGEYIVASTRTFLRLYTQADHDITSSLYTPIESLTPLVQDPSAENLLNHRVQYIITDSTFHFFPTNNTGLEVPAGVEPMVSSLGYAIYQVMKN